MKLTDEKIYEIIDRLNAELNKYHLETAYKSLDKICIEINWGDWKHNHLCTKWIVEEVLDMMGFSGQYTMTEEITEENGSDTYSALHTIRFI